MVTLQDIHFLMPEIVMAVGAVIIMLAIAVKRDYTLSYGLTLATFLAAFGILVLNPTETRPVTELLLADPLGKFLSGLIIASAFIITIFSYPYFRIQKEVKEEYYILLILATLGAVLMTISNHFISFVISLEILSVSVFALIGYLKKLEISIEASIKYLILAAVATGFILFGFSLIYLSTGSMSLAQLTQTPAEGSFSLLLLTGLGLTIVGFGFKMALVPFHFWTPDIYSAAPAPVSTFVATISKGAAFVFLLRLFYSIGGLNNDNIWVVFAVLAFASMFVGNWLGLQQKNLKRLLAYSSISHLGYLMVGFLAFSDDGIRSSAFYLTAYFASILAAFGMITYLTSEHDGEPYMIENYRGLFWSKPWLAAFFTLVMLSLAGIPFTAGFMGKFYLLSSGMSAGKIVLLVSLVVSSTIGLFYYLKVVQVMLTRSETQHEFYIGRHSILMQAVVAVLFVVILWMGVFPSAFLSMIGM